MTSVEVYGVVLLAPDQTTMMFARGVHHIKSSLKTTKASKALAAAATVVEVVVLDFDYQNKVVEVSMRESLVETATKAAAAAAASDVSTVAVGKNNKRSKSTPATATTTGGGGSVSGGVLTLTGGRLRARVELVKPQYLVVSLADTDNSNNNSGPSPCAGAVIAYLMLADYHCPHLLSTPTPSSTNPPSGAGGGGGDSTPPLFQEGQTVSAVVVRPALTTQPSLEAKSGLHASVAILAISSDTSNSNSNSNKQGITGSSGDSNAPSGVAGGERGGAEDRQNNRTLTNQEAAKVTHQS